MFIHHKNHVSKNTNRSAFGLIEVMISAMILSISLLGIASIQSKALNIVIEASKKETAYRMIGQLSNFALTADINQVYNLVAKSPSTDTTLCYASLATTATTPCTTPVFYQTMIAEWNDILSKILPGGSGCTCAIIGASSQPTTFRSAIKWTTLSGTTSVVYLDNQILLSGALPTTPQITLSNSYLCPVVTPDTNSPQTICHFS